MKVIISTCPEREVATLTGELLKEKLIACVNVINGITSRYWWQDKIQSDTESILIIKTKSALVEKVMSRIKELHSYEIPEILVIDVEKANVEYLKWVEESTV